MMPRRAFIASTASAGILATSNLAGADVVRPEHAVEMFRLLPHAQLAVLPGTDHMNIVKRTDWEVSMVEAFLDTPMPA
jgi:hypothetical protein